MLTSTGITNKSLTAALKGLVGKRKIRIAFIPTAANVEPGEKSWLIHSYNNCEKLGIVDIVDISALEKRVWLPRLRKANVIFVGGGDPDHLMRWVRKSGLQKELPSLLKSKVYVGISAGSMILLKRFFSSQGLGYVDFNFRPHLNSPYFPEATEEKISSVAKRLKGDTYAIGDGSAIVWTDGKIRIISDGTWRKYPGKK